MKMITRFPMWYYTVSTLFAWSSIVLILYCWNIVTEKKGTIEAANIGARTAHEKDLLYRRWNAGHGGVYVPITDETKPNIYLKISEREIQTPGGTMLTKINPAFMTRQVHEMAEAESGVKGHITSLKPIRPENAPDAWEKNALMALDRGEEEITSVEIMNGESYLRFIRPLITEKKCLNCHAIQGYKLGDIRGGISVSVPLSPLKRIETNHIWTFSLTYALLWFLGVVGITAGFFILNRQINHQKEIEKKLRVQEKMHGVIEMAGGVSHELNQPMQVVLTACEFINSDKRKDTPYSDELDMLIAQIEKMRTITQKLMGITRYKTKKYLNGKIIDIDEASDFKIKK